MKNTKWMFATVACGAILTGCAEAEVDQANAAPPAQQTPTENAQNNHVATFEETTFRGELPSGGSITIKMPVDEMSLVADIREAAGIAPMTYMEVDLDNVKGTEDYFLDDVYATTDLGEEVLFEHHLSMYQLWMPDLEDPNGEWQMPDGRQVTQREVDDHAHKIRTLNDSNDDDDRWVDPMQMGDLTLSAQFDQPVTEIVKLEAISSDREVTTLKPITTE